MLHIFTELSYLSLSEDFPPSCACWTPGFWVSSIFAASTRYLILLLLNHSGVWGSPLLAMLLKFLSQTLSTGSEFFCSSYRIGILVLIFLSLLYSPFLDSLFVQLLTAFATKPLLLILNYSHMWAILTVALCHLLSETRISRQSLLNSSHIRPIAHDINIFSWRPYCISDGKHYITSQMEFFLGQPNFNQF